MKTATAFTQCHTRVASLWRRIGVPGGGVSSGPDRSRASMADL